MSRVRPPDPVPELEKHYSIPELAELLSVSRDQVEKLLRTGELHSRRVGARRRIPASEVRRYLDENNPDDELEDLPALRVARR